jgi:hypothetical protein
VRFCALSIPSFILFTKLLKSIMNKFSNKRLNRNMCSEFLFPVRQVNVSSTLYDSTSTLYDSTSTLYD